MGIEKSKISITYEDSALLVINKPSGLLTHPKNLKDQSESVVSWLIQKYPQIKGVGEDKLRPGIVHRLDKETSGLLVIAKTQAAFDYLKKLFQERKISKVYLALVYGHLKNRTGIIEAPLGKLGTHQTTRTHGKRELKEKEAITEYKVADYYSPRKASQRGRLLTTNYSLLEVHPLTGRTNQIRVHLKSIGHPVVCDGIYGGRRLLCPPQLGRLFLHAQKLSFTAPSGQALTLEADLPEDLTDFLENLKRQ